jgi:hypothetical protein
VEVFSDIWYPFLEVIKEEILKLASELYACWSTADDNHVEKTLDFFRILVLKSGGFAAVHYSSSNSLGIIDFFEEKTMFPNTGNT